MTKLKECEAAALKVAALLNDDSGEWEKTTGYSHFLAPINHHKYAAELTDVYKDAHASSTMLVIELNSWVEVNHLDTLGVYHKPGKNTPDESIARVKQWRADELRHLFAKYGIKTKHLTPFEEPNSLIPLEYLGIDLTQRNLLSNLKKMELDIERSPMDITPEKMLLGEGQGR